MTEYPPPPPGDYPPPPPPSGGYPPPPPGGLPANAPGYPGYPGAVQKTNSMAIASLVSSCVGILCGIGAIAGIVLGIIARNQIKTNGESGDGLALAGIIVGAVTLLISVIWVVYWLSVVSTTSY